jgi:hypothetical protein
MTAPEPKWTWRLLMESVFLICLLVTGIWYLWGRQYWRVSRDVLLRLPDFAPTYLFIGTNGIAVAMDAATRKVAFLDRSGTAMVYTHSDIIAAEICKSMVSFAKINRLNQVISALVWHSLFGPKGFRVGGLTGSTTTSERSNAISLKIYLNDASAPVREIVFYRGAAIATSSAKYERYAAAADEWQARLRLAASDHDPSRKESLRSMHAKTRLRGTLASPPRG